jgi:hypothetical protein
MRLNFILRSLATILFFILLLFLFPKNLFIGDISNLFTAVTVLFGILTGFFIAATLTNYFKLQSLISEETAGLISLYRISIILSPKIKNEIASAIDKYLISAFDFELYNYIEKNWKEFNYIIKILDKIKVKNTEIYQHFLQTRDNLFRIRQEIDLAGRKIIGFEYWMILIILSIIMIFLLYIMRESTISSSIFTVILSSTICLVLYSLYEIDTNTFAEEKLAFHIFQPVFKNIGKLPYYPLVSIKGRRMKPPKGKCRIGIHENYPKSLKKEIKVMEFK